MKYVVWLMFGALFMLHHDFWWWNDPSLVLGFLPIGMAWHVGFSVVASLFWLIALKFAWPSDIEQWAEQSDAQ